MASYFAAFAPAPDWDDLVSWPPDVFALTNLVLDHTEGYRFVVAPPPGRRWPPLPDWGAQVQLAAEGWRSAAGEPSAQAPELVRRCWDVVTRLRDVPLARIRSGDAWELDEALLTLHSTADEACAHVASAGTSASEQSFEARAWRLLQARGSLSRLSPARVRIVPKTHFTLRGITIRSLSRYVALCYESVDVRWRSIESRPSEDRPDYTIVLVPWPLDVRASDFRPAPPDVLANMDRDRFGFFEFAPESPLDTELLGALLETAVDDAGRVDTVVLPEGAVSPEEIRGLEDTLAEHGATFLIAGVRQPPAGHCFGRNYLHFGVRSSAGWDRYEQDKHHRWFLDAGQIRQYHLTRSLDPRKLWWEAIDVRERTLHVIDVGGGVTTAPLVCEDLARLDEVADLVRRIGPSLVVALLLDGPQLASRWPCRYASILADEPGSAVLTLTSSGMAARSRPPGKSRSRVVAHWNGPTDGPREIELAPRAAAVLLTAAVEGRTLWTADGRCHRNVPGLTLSGVHQLRPRGRSGTTIARRPAGPGRATASGPSGSGSPTGRGTPRRSRRAARSAPARTRRRGS
ncbi:MAG TPA: hypothetical protein VLB86_01485 [Gaiellaceae bacterium]|nr:hypothetical protein [Gaiellaceae bacterium]